MFKQRDFLRFNLRVVPFTTGLFLVVYCLVQFLSERLGFSPVISLIAPEGLTMGESILMFVLILALSNAITLNLAFYLIQKARKPRKNSSGPKLVAYIACLIGLILAFAYLIFALVSIPVEIYAFLGVEGLLYYFEFTSWWIGIHLALLAIVLYYVLYSSSEIMWLIKKRKEEKK